MTDFVLFAALFIVFIVLRGNASLVGTFDLTLALEETLLLLFSSVTYGMALVAAVRMNRAMTLGLLGATALLGSAFLYLEVSEFLSLILAGHGPQTNGLYSAFFTLVGTHGLHIAVGLVWMMFVCGLVLWQGLTRQVMRKMLLLGLFWHFLDLVWIFIFTIVYLMSVL